MDTKQSTKRPAQTPDPIPQPKQITVRDVAPAKISALAPFANESIISHNDRLLYNRILNEEYINGITLEKTKPPAGSRAEWFFKIKDAAGRNPEHITPPLHMVDCNLTGIGSAGTTKDPTPLDASFYALCTKNVDKSLLQDNPDLQKHIDDYFNVHLRKLTEHLMIKAFDMKDVQTTMRQECIKAAINKCLADGLIKREELKTMGTDTPGPIRDRALKYWMKKTNTYLNKRKKEEKKEDGEQEMMADAFISEEEEDEEYIPEALMFSSKVYTMTKGQTKEVVLARYAKEQNKRKLKETTQEDEISIMTSIGVRYNKIDYYIQKSSIPLRELMVQEKIKEMTAYRKMIRETTGKEIDNIQFQQLGQQAKRDIADPFREWAPRGTDAQFQIYPEVYSAAGKLGVRYVMVTKLIIVKRGVAGASAPMVTSVTFEGADGLNAFMDGDAGMIEKVEEEDKKQLDDRDKKMAEMSLGSQSDLPQKGTAEGTANTSTDKGEAQDERVQQSARKPGGANEGKKQPPAKKEEELPALMDYDPPKANNKAQHKRTQGQMKPTEEEEEPEPEPIVERTKRAKRTKPLSEI